MSIEQYFQALAERLHSSAHVRTVYGEPVETPGKTVIVSGGRVDRAVGHIALSPGGIVTPPGFTAAQGLL